MSDFWKECKYTLLQHAPNGRLVVTDDYLRAYYARPELAPVPESCDAERALYQTLMADPRRRVSEQEIDALADVDTRENYRVMLRFRDQLLAAPDLDTFYFDLFRRDVAVPPMFIHHTAQVILRGLLEGVTNGLEARAAELFFRAQRVSVKDGAIMLADDETVEMHATGGVPGNLGRLLAEAQAPVRTVELDVLDDKNSAEYFNRDERHDTVLNLGYAGPGSLALCRVLERWIAHFHGVKMAISPVREIPDSDWLWHVGLDAEATIMLNEIYTGGEIGEERMKRIIGLYRIDFADASVLRSDIAGSPVFLGLAMTADGALRMKPQNLLLNLPLARRV